MGIISGPPARERHPGQKLTQAFAIPQISTGTCCGGVKNGTELGKKAKVFMDAGDWSPTRWSWHRKGAPRGARLREGFILDGFPRTIPRPRLDR